jgi:hypothetical protein
MRAPKPSSCRHTRKTHPYPVYVIHLPVLGVIALVMLNTGIPSLWKYVILTLSTYAASNLLVLGYREVFKPFALRRLAW